MKPSELTPFFKKVNFSPVGKINFLRICLVLVLLLTLDANGSHAFEFCNDECNTTVFANNLLPEIPGLSLLPVNSEQAKGDSHWPKAEHSCCHHHNFLFNNQIDMEVLIKTSLVGFSPPKMNSDPHILGPFQPPRA